MAQDLEEIALFPLNAVLFPYAQLQLHVFEERYREMIRECLEFDKPFGIVLIRTGTETGPADPYMVGTAVRIIGCHTYDDGRMDIQVQGERRFRIRQMDNSKPFLVGRVEPVIEMEIDDTPEAEALMLRAREDCKTLVQQRFENQGIPVKRVVFSQDPVVLSFTIANLLTMENLEKQRLLETTDTLERVQTLIPILEMQMMEGCQDPKSNHYRLTPTDLAEWIIPN